MHMNPPPVIITKSNNDDKLYRYYVKIKLRRDPKSQKLDPYEFKIVLFFNVNPEGFLLFITNFDMIIKALETIFTGAKIQSLFTLVNVEVLPQFDTLSDESGSTTSENSKSIIMGLGTYFFCQCAAKKNCTMRQRMRKPCGLKVRRYASHLIGLNKYLVVFPG